MKSQNDEPVVSVLDGAVTIEDRPGNANPWAIVDTQTGAEIDVCPEEVPAMITLFRAFRRSIAESNHPRAQTPDHDCTEHALSHDVDGLDDPIDECTICGQMTTS